MTTQERRPAVGARHRAMSACPARTPIAPKVSVEAPTESWGAPWTSAVSALPTAPDNSSTQSPVPAPSAWHTGGIKTRHASALPSTCARSAWSVSGGDGPPDLAAQDARGRRAAALEPEDAGCTRIP